MIALALVGTFFTFFGCKSEKTHTASDVVSLSISSGDMDLRNSYSFGISLKDDVWIFYADCFAADGETPIKLETPIENDDAENLLADAEKSGFITSPKKYKKSIFGKSVADETIYSSLVTFSDGEKVSIPTLLSRDIETDFYALAEKYSKKE